MEVHYRLHEVPGHLTWSTVAQARAKSVAFLRQVWRFSLQRLLFSPPLPCGATRHAHSLETSPDREPRCFPCRSAVKRRVGGSGTPLFPGRGCELEEL